MKRLFYPLLISLTFIPSIWRQGEIKAVKVKADSLIGDVKFQVQIRSAIIQIFITLSFLAGAYQLQGQDPIDQEIARMELTKDSLILVKSQLELRITSLSDSISGMRIEKASQGATTLAVLSKNTFLRKEPNNFGRAIFSVREGDSVEVLDSDLKFLKCLIRGTIGYISIDYFKNDDDLVNFRLMKEDERRKEDAAIKKKKDDDLAKLKLKKEAAEQAKQAAEQAKQAAELAEQDERMKEFQLDFERPYKEKGVGLTIWNISISDINSANGVSFLIDWAHLIPDKIVKYVDFYVTPFNAVGDAVNCELRGNRQFKGRVTGPISFHYVVERSEWENAWYNNTVNCIRLDQVIVYYTDGSNYTYIKELPKLYRESFENDCRY